MKSLINLIILSLTTVVMINAQEIPDGQLDFESTPVSVQSGITKAMNRSAQKADGVWLSNPYFRSHFSETAVSMSLANNKMVWSWSLTSINNTDAVLSTPVLHETKTSEYVDYTRTNITERYLFHGRSIEQQFIIATMPKEKHITIEGHILTEGAFQKKADHWLWANDKGSIRLGELFVYDAVGQEIEARFEVSDHKTCIHIEEEALASATFPVTIDPEIGPDDFRISFMGPNGNLNFDAQRPAVSYNSQEDRYLVVWDGDETVGAAVNNELEIHGQYINTDGSLFQDRFRISFMGPDGDASFDGEIPDVAYNPVTNQHLVVWSGDSTANNEFQIWGQFVDHNAQLVGNNFQISETGTVTGDNNPQDTNGPAITYNTTDDEFLVVWPGNVGSGEFEIIGQVVDGTGGVVADDFQISQQGPDGDDGFPAGRPDIIHNTQENEYLVVWHGQDTIGNLVQAEVEIYGQLVSNAGAEIGTDFRISDMGEDGEGQFDALSPAVAYNAMQNDYLVVWAGDDESESDFQIYAQLLNAAGAEIGDNDVQISDMDDGPGNGNSGPVFSAESPSVCYSPLENKYLVIWDGDNNGTQVEAFGQFLDASLSELSPNDFRISTIDETGEERREIRVNALAFNSTDGTFLSVWSGEDTGTNEDFEIFGQFLDISTIKPIGQFRISFQGPDGNDDFDAVVPVIAHNTIEKNYLVVWMGSRFVASQFNTEFEVFGQLVSSGGLFIGEAFRISDMGPDGDTNFDATRPSVTYNVVDNEYLVVWQGDDDNNGLVNEEDEVFGQRLDASGNEIGTNDFRISDMGPDGNDDFEARFPNVTYNDVDNEYLVVWQGSDTTNGLVSGEFEIYGQRLDADGNEIGMNDVRISDMGPDGNDDFDALFPNVTYNVMDNEYLVVWYGDDNTLPLIEGESEIFGQRLDADGNEIGMNDFRISDTGPDGSVEFDARDPSVAYNAVENEYLVVWEGTLSAISETTTEVEIFGQRLDTHGKELGANDFRISDMGPDGNALFDAEDPSVTYNSLENEYLVVWGGELSAIFQNTSELEIFGQRLDVTGNELGTNDFRISEMGSDGEFNFDAVNPSVTYNAVENEYFVVWQGDDNTAPLVDQEFEIFGEILSFGACLEVLTDLELGSPILSGIYQASDVINSSGLLEANSDVILDAGTEINLLPNFETQLGALLEILIGGCE